MFNKTNKGQKGKKESQITENYMKLMLDMFSKEINETFSEKLLNETRSSKTLYMEAGFEYIGEYTIIGEKIIHFFLTREKEKRGPYIFE